MKKLKKLTFWILGVSLVLAYIYLLVGRDLIRMSEGDKIIKLALQNKHKDFALGSDGYYSDFNTVTRLRPEFFEA